MKRSAVILLIVFICRAACDDFQSTLGHLKPQASPEVQTRAALDLIRRIVPDRAYAFLASVDVTIGPAGKDTFRVTKLGNGSVEIVGTTGVAVATGFNHYLKYYCFAHVSWEISQLELPDDLPEVNLTITSRDRFRYYQNVCTTSYSFVWWNWRQWEKHIDWMALNSFNLVLASSGQEAIWSRVYQQLNMTQSEIDEQFAGPAFLSWSRMGNIRGWGGPLSNAWHQRSLVLQKLIVKRMRSLGILTVLPAFAGHVPRAFKRLYPNASMVAVGAWNGFNGTYCCPFLLDPTEAIFKTTGNLFLQELISEFGTDHVYSCDTFNEMEPFTKNLTYLSQIGRSTYSAMTDVDVRAIWLLQGWAFYSEEDFWKTEDVRAYLRSVPLGKMIVLDLQAEQFPQYDRLQSYFGQPYIWCMLHNFGGTLGMYGSADIINQRPVAARKETGSTMIGTGVTAEGINQNYVIYDLMAETSWRDKPTNLSAWFSYYTHRRYGQAEENADAAWQILATTVYNFNGPERLRGKYVINRSPSMNLTPWYWYNMCDVYESWNHLLGASETLRDSLGYRHDLVDFTRQVLQHVADEIYNEIVYAFKSRQLDALQNAAAQFFMVFEDLEEILATNEAFLLGVWLNSAKNASLNEQDRKLFELNARNQITLWGPTGEIKDYASKQWSGVVSRYFKPRWAVFLKEAHNALVENRAINKTAVARAIFDTVEEPFMYDRSEVPEQPIGDTVEVARKIYAKWWPSIHCRSARRAAQSYDFIGQNEEVRDHRQEDVDIILMH